MKRRVLFLTSLLSACFALAADDTRDISTAIYLHKGTKRVFRASESFLSARPAAFDLTKPDLERIIQQFATQSDSRVSSVIVGFRERSTPTGSFSAMPFEVVSYVTTDAKRVVLDGSGLLVIFGDGTILSPQVVPMTPDEIETAKKRLEGH
jgi:hypothetical protein